MRSDDTLTEKERKILEGIHEKNESFNVDGPSEQDLEFLQKCYLGKSMQLSEDWMCVYILYMDNVYG